MPGPGKPGGPTKLTRELEEIAFDYLGKGASWDTIAAALGVSRSTVNNWLRKGANGNPTFREFTKGCNAAIARSEMNALDCLDGAMKDKIWQSAAWLLERRFPHRWGRQDRAIIQQGVAESLDHMLDYLQGKLPKEAYQQVVMALAAYADEKEQQAGVEEPIAVELPDPSEH